MAKIILKSAENSYTVNGIEVQKGTLIINHSSDGISIKGVYADVSEIECDGLSFSTKFELDEWISDNCFRVGGGNGNGVAKSINGLIDVGDGLSLSGEGTTDDPYILVSTTPDSLVFQGFWNVVTNIPVLSNLVPSTNGFFYIVTDADPSNGTDRNLGNGNQTFRNGDWVVWSDVLGRWGKVVASNNVLSVNSQTGQVDLAASNMGMTIDGEPMPELPSDPSQISNDVSILRNMMRLQDQISGKSWANLTGSRVKNTSYRNTTGRDINVVISHDSGTAGRVQVSINNITWIDVATTRISNVGQVVSFIVPDTYYYRTQGDIVVWSELR